MKLCSVEKQNMHTVVRLFGIKMSFLNRKLERERKLYKFIYNKIYLSNLIKDVHSKSFLKFKNINSGKDVVIVATGPTMADYTPLNAVHIGVNKAFQRRDLKLNYMFTHDYSVSKDYIEDFLNYPAEKFLGHGVSFKFPNEKVIPIKYFEKDDVNRYYLESQYLSLDPNIAYHGLAVSGSVVFCALQFALYTHPRRIYLVGCDCTNAGYFDGTQQIHVMKKQIIDSSWKIFKEYNQCFYPDVEIISINPVGLKGLFKDIYTKKYVEKNTHLKDVELIEG